MRVEDRLVPINALWGMLHGGVGMPAPLQAAGFRLQGIEIPIGDGEHRIDLDALAYNAATGEVLAIECKCGQNVNIDQIRRLVSVDPIDVIQEVGLRMVADAEPTLLPVLLGLHEYSDRLHRGLARAAQDNIDLSGLALATYDQTGGVFVSADWPVSGTLAQVLPCEGAGPYPRMIKYDRESTAVELENVVAAELVAALSREAPSVEVRSLAERVVPQFGLAGRGEQSQILRTVEVAAQTVCLQMESHFEYRGATAARSNAVVLLSSSPEESDPRGRTQQYQMLARRYGVAVGPTSEALHQGKLWDVLDQLDDDEATAAALEQLDGGEEEGDDG